MIRSVNFEILNLKKMGFVWASYLEKVIIRRAFFCRVMTGLMLVFYVLPHVMRPYVKCG